MQKTYHICSSLISMKLLFYIFALFAGQNIFAQVYGCTDPLSENYNPDATVNDGSCSYAKAKVTPQVLGLLDDKIHETSGLIMMDNGIWTHNDDTDTSLHSLDTLTGTITRSVRLTGVHNTDWEEIDQDSAYVYVGDFGNNYRGNRLDLHVLKIGKAGLLRSTPETERINFTYANQTDLTSPGSNRTDFDCEAMVAGKDSLFLFTKQWKSKQTTIYRLPKVPGAYNLEPGKSFNVEGLVTGAVYLEDKHLLVLCGYGRMGSPFLYVFYGFTGNDFFGGNKRRIAINEGIMQVEGITTNDGLHYYISCESFVKRPLVNSPARLMSIDLTEYLKPYLDTLKP